MKLLIILLPLINFVLLKASGRNIGKNGAMILSSLTIGLLSLISVYTTLFNCISKSYTTINVLPWFDLELVSIPFSFQFDFSSSLIISLICVVSFLIHLYSMEYMKEDPHIIRFLSYLSLFSGFMIVLVTANNFLLLFIGWEGVGICSYLLIGFWFTRIEASKSALKAMIINRIGDLSLICGMIILYYNLGSLEFNVIFTCVEELTENQVNLALIFIIIGVVGKSAQIGLHMWLPDAMEGPTPVSALIHAATMVTAGIFLVIKISPLFSLSSVSLFLISFFGSITALISATIGLTQNDLKKVIAYSTCSQLGFMAIICGFSYYDVGLFHLINHGFFKALLFLSAGSIIHGLADNQDTRIMGSLIISQPLTFTCFIIGSIALGGLPFLSGYYSKDLLIELISDNKKVNFLIVMALSATLLTSIYSSRLLFLTFWNENNSKFYSYLKSHEPGFFITIVIIILSLASVIIGFMSKWFILIPYTPPFIQTDLKLLPLWLTVGGFASVILSYSFKNFFTKINFWTKVYFNKIYFMLVSTWYFDVLINHYVINPVMRFSFNTSYKIIDNQVLEFFGPKSLSSSPLLLSKPLSKWANGDLFLYVVYIMMVFFIFLFLTNQ